MARTIGKDNIRLVQYMTRTVKAEGFKDVQSEVEKRLPNKMYEKYESAWSEIQRIIWDTMSERS